MNAGFFNRFKGDQCFGNIVSDGHHIQFSDTINANFGITKEGEYIIGYMTAEEAKSYDFEQLVTGVVWLVKDSKNFVEESLKFENMDTQHSGSGEQFVNLRASRTALGFNKEGELLMVQMDGDGNHNLGLQLKEMAEMMIKLGAIGAINLDGGGSSTTVIHNEISNYVSDGCSKASNDLYRCPRAVSTITCVHDSHFISKEEISDTRIYIELSIVIIFGVMILFCLISLVILLLLHHYFTASNQNKPSASGYESVKSYELDNMDDEDLYEQQHQENILRE
eukprot:CAMPEP_0117424282 /NCGR_PEP_ID=MMETSP0758-20121206/4732_1 /TAXON_ID=63605 /ORGANISM="Percolomonas cosmopolitus, Strain AE-1 (ATCC 50343)" /LENGTH=279 /DNA_ID=CAMNT_0005207967 /DNA_START=381 /DNA_END=1217 /DNA_ORIENTATION=+